MPGDYSRFTHKAQKRFSSVRLQQGRVQLDADWNELTEIFARRFERQAEDTFGSRAVPRATTPKAFEITQPGLAIGTGRIYVDGLVAEVFDDDQATYDNQPFLPEPPASSAFNGKDVLVYVDVWNREVTYIEDPELLEIALGGPDTTTRVQTVWQVKLLGPEQVNGPVDCKIDFAAVFPASAGRITTQAVQAKASTDPCILPESGGYRGIENRLYRVEIHAAKGAPPPRWKWSRDNASIVSSVEAIAIAGTSALTVTQIGRDSVLRFRVNDWVEILDDHLELAGEPGVMAQVASIQEASRKLVLDRALPAGVFDPTDPKRRTRVKRWDQSAGVDGDGLLPIGSGFVALEDGVEIELELDAAAPGGKFHGGDYWVFAARSADASVEQLQKAPPRGIRHHYAPLATIANFGPAATPNDCRTLWPPLGEGHGCDCTVCVSEASHKDGSLTIENAVALIKEQGGGKICLGQGVFPLRRTVEISGVQALVIVGHGTSSHVIGPEQGPAFDIKDGSSDITIERLRVITPSIDRAIGIAISNALDVTIEKCTIGPVETDPKARENLVAISIQGVTLGLEIRDNQLMCGVGISAGPELVFGAAFRVVGNWIDAPLMGLRFGTPEHPFIYQDAAITGNLLHAGQAGARIIAVGQDDALVIADNFIEADRMGLELSVDHTLIESNRLRWSGSESSTATTGIGLRDTPAVPGKVNTRIFSNSIDGFTEYGIAIEQHLAVAMIKHNIIRNVGGGGIVMGAGASADQLSLENNELLEIGNRESAPIAMGVFLSRVSDGVIANNVVSRVGLINGLAPIALGLALNVPRRVRILGNHISDIGVNGESSRPGVGMLVTAPYDDVTIGNNHVERTSAGTFQAVAAWSALIVGRVPDVSQFFGKAGLLDLDFKLKAIGPQTFFFSNTLLALLNGQGGLSVFGNAFESFGTRSEAVDLEGTSCVFQGNRCRFTGERHPDRIVKIAGPRLVAGDNVVEGPVRAQGLALLPDVANGGHFTLLGNIVSFGIEVDGAALPASSPFKPLNVIV